jgi:hypothetical protein
MTERLSHELASLLAEDDGSLGRVEARDLLRARLARDISEGLTEGSPEHGGREAIEYARVAAYLDCAVSPAERDAIAAKLADDPGFRSEVASAVLLLDGLEAKPAAVPAELVARAVGILTAARPVGPRASVAWFAPIAIWSRRPAAWSGLAAVLLVAALTPAIVSMVREQHEAPAPTLPDAKGVPASRGVVPSPAGKGQEKDNRSCDDSSGPAKDLRPRSGEPGTSVDRAAKTPGRSAQPPSAAPDDDPCRPKPAGEDARKP